MYTLQNNKILRALVTFLFVTVLLLPIVYTFTDTTYAGGNAADKAASAPEGQKGILDTTSWGQVVGYMIIGLASYLTGVGGSILESALENLVLGFGGLIQGTGSSWWSPAGDSLGTTIDALWGFIRDLSNLVFIFGFIYIGIRTIIDYESASTKRMLAQLIIAALLINFSLFFTKIIIDFGNLTAVEIYNTATGGTGSISESIADVLGITDFYKHGNYEGLAGLTTGGTISFFIMSALLLIIAAFVLAAGGILLIIRFVALVFIMIFSPILFAATVFPQTKKYSDMLWGKLINYSFFPAIYILLLLISLKVLETGLGALRSKRIGNVLAQPEAGGFEIVVLFIVAIMFFIMSLKLATQLGMAGGNMAVNMGNNLRGKAQSWMGRTAIGRGSDWALKKYENLDAKASKATGARGMGLKTLRAGVAGIAGGDRGLRSTLEAGKKAKFGGSYSRADDIAYAEERKKRQANLNELGDFKKTASDGAQMIREGKLTSDADKVKLERAVADASVKYLEELDQKDREAIVGYMTQNQIEGLEKSDKLSDTDKAALSKSRRAHFEKIYQHNKELLSKANADSLAALGQTYLSDEENAVRLTSSQLDDLKKKLTPTEVKMISDSRERGLGKLASGKSISTYEKGIANTPVYLNYEYITKQKPGEIAKMPADTLKQLSSQPMTQLSISTLSKITQDGTLSKDDQRIIRSNIESQISSNSLASKDDYENWFETPLGRQFGK